MGKPISYLLNCATQHNNYESFKKYVFGRSSDEIQLEIDFLNEYADKLSQRRTYVNNNCTQYCSTYKIMGEIYSRVSDLEYELISRQEKRNVIMNKNDEVKFIKSINKFYDDWSKELEHDIRKQTQETSNPKEAKMTNTIKNFFVDLFPKKLETPTKDDIHFLKLLSHKLNHIPVIDGLEPNYINKFNSIIEKISNMSNNK